MNCFASLGVVLFFTTIFRRADAIYCYQCNSTQIRDQFQCGEKFGNSDLQPQSCHEVYGAKYCIKQVGHLEGEGYLFVCTLLVEGIKCFQCYAAFNISCSDSLIHDSDMEPKDCDHVFEAAYCVKTTGLYAGGVGTRRFCSSSDLGSYCNYVRQPGDTLPPYRSCFFTCTGDGCNNTSTTIPSLLTLLILLFMLFL